MSDESAENFLRDQLEALMASPALAPVANRHTEDSDLPPDVEASNYDRETELSSDQQLLRDALRLGLK
ncbi:MAG TPA: hypothetical protein VGC79_15820 [Polyangiaceae bacterium]